MLLISKKEKNQWKRKNRTFRIFISIFVAIVSISAHCVFASVYEYHIGQDTVLGDNIYIRTIKGDKCFSIRHRYDLSYRNIKLSNMRIDFNKKLNRKKILIPAIILPSYRNDIVINVPELRMYFFCKGFVFIFPVGLGRNEWRTPIMNTNVQNKMHNPTWHVPESIQEYSYINKDIELPDIIPPGPTNPLGEYAIRLSAPSYMIHGTNIQSSVGKFVSSGCIRMWKDHIKFLYENSYIGMPIHIINENVKIGVKNNSVYIESYKSVDGYEDGKDFIEIINKIERIVGYKLELYQIENIKKIIDRCDGIPREILIRKQSSIDQDFNRKHVPIQVQRANHSVIVTPYFVI